jgi:hypothetical protein
VIMPDEVKLKLGKGLAFVKRRLKRLRPIYHRVADRVRAHILLCLLAYYVEWHLMQAWEPLLLKLRSGDGMPARRTRIPDFVRYWNTDIGRPRIESPGWGHGRSRRFESIHGSPSATLRQSSI